MNELEKALGYNFKDSQILRLALRHKSHAHEEHRKMPTEEFVLLHNERLEFLGDAVLQLVISDLLFERYGNVDEGKLSKMRSSLVNEDMLTEIARRLNLGHFVLLGKGELSSGGAEKRSILSSTYEAILGALYLDGGFASVFKVIENHFELLFDKVGEIDFYRDYKTRLQEWVQRRYHRSPNYKVSKEEGPDHQKSFEVVVSVGRKKGAGMGRSKKEAEQEAARVLLHELQKVEQKNQKTTANGNA